MSQTDEIDWLAEAKKRPIVNTGQIDKRTLGRLRRAATKGEILYWRGYWDTLSPHFGLGPLKSCFGPVPGLEPDPDPAPAASAPIAETIVEPIARHVGRYLVPAIVLPALLPTQVFARPGCKIRLRLPDVRNGPFGVVQALLMLTILPAAGALLPILFLW